MATQLATRNNANLPAVAEEDRPLVAFRSQLEQRAAEFKMVLPDHISPEKLQRTILTAVQGDLELLKASRQTLMLACMKAAQDGLLPDKREAALVIFSTRQKGADGQWTSVKTVQYMPMVYGLRMKILRSGEVIDITAKVVYRREAEEGFFVYEEGTESMLRHRPMLDIGPEDATDDQIIAAYSMATYKDGTKSYEVMRRFEIDQVRQVSQTGALGKTDRNGKPIPPKGPWVDWYSEMAKKTVMRRHAKTLPMSGDILDSMERDDSFTVQSIDGALGMGDEEPAQLAPPRRGDAPATEERHDPQTGEIIDEQSNAAEETAQAGADTELRDSQGFTVDPRDQAAQRIIDRIEGRASAFAIDNILKEREVVEAMEAMPEEMTSVIWRAARDRKAEIASERAAEESAK